MQHGGDFWSEIVGQDTAIATLQHVLSPEGQSDLAHAWLITGPPGSGRSNLAYRFAAALIARDESEREAVFQQVEAHTHPDLEVLTTEGVIITVKEARRIAERAHFSPSVGRYRVIVAEDADRLPADSSNTLLKVLEEPPERTVWILCAPSEADLLPTIRSRTRALRLVTPQASDVARLLHERDGIDPAEAERAARLAQSHIGMARRLATDADALERRRKTVSEVLGIETLGDAMRAAANLLKLAEADAKALTEERNETERAEALRTLGIAPGAAIPPRLRGQVRALEEDQKRRERRSLFDGIDRIFTDLTSVYRDALIISFGSDAELVNEEMTAELREFVARTDAGRILSVIDAIDHARERLLRNVPASLALEALFARIFVEVTARRERNQ